MAAGINREEQPLGAQKIIQGLARDTGFNQAIHILSVQFQHRRHLRQIERDAAAHRVDMAFKRCAGPEGHHRHAMLMAQHHDAAYFIRGLHKGDRIGQRWRRGILTPAMLFAHGLGGAEPFTQEAADAGNDLCYGGGAGIHGVSSCRRRKAGGGLHPFCRLRGGASSGASSGPGGSGLAFPPSTSPRRKQGNAE